MGTGSTLIAANQLSRHGLGIELSEEYAEIARNRLNFDQLTFGNLIVY